MDSHHHPLQRLASPSYTYSALLHAAGLASFSASWRWLAKSDTIISYQYGWHFQFLTIVGLTLATATFGVGLAADASGSRRLFTAKNTLSTCSAPLEVLISILYWGLRAVDESLVISEHMILATLPDLGFHLVPSVLLVLDLLFFSPPWTVRVYSAAQTSILLGFLYWFWIEWCFNINQVYPYPLLALLNVPQRILLFTFSALLMAANTMALKWLYGAVNGYESIKAEAHKPLKKVE